MTIRYGLTVLVAVVLAYAYYETRQWRKTPDIVSPRQRRIRSLGLLFLLMSIVLWIGGTYLPPPPLFRGHPPTPAARDLAIKLMVYWSVTALMLVPLVPLALMDARENLKNASDQRRKMRMEALSILDNIPEEVHPAELDGVIEDNSHTRA